MMTSTNNQHSIPHSAKSFRFSRAAVGLLCATIVLAVVLVISTVQNINREQNLMEKFLLDKAETIMRAIEAGSRATMMHHMGRGNPLNTLLTEYSKDEDIHYISITDTNGQVINHVGPDVHRVFSKEEEQKLTDDNVSITRLDKKSGIFSLSKTFEAEHQYQHMPMSSRMVKRMMPDSAGKKILSIGLSTRQFDLARQQDVRHAIFMGAILFLVGSAGLYFLFLYQDVRRTSSNLADMQLYTKNVIESIPVGLITLDAHNSIVSCNKNTEKLFGLKLTEIEKKDIHEVLPDCSAPFAESCNSLFETEAHCTGSKGKQIPLRISCSPLVNNDNEEIGKVLILRDMSSIREMEIQLERSRRMAALGKMAAGIAHEIRNPLGTLRGFAQFFGNQQNTNEDSKNYSKLMISEIDRLNQTVSALLQFSRPRDLQRQVIDIDELFEKTVSMMQADFENKQIDLVLKKNTGIQLNGDPDLLLQVLMNLLKNSVNSISSGGRISLECRQDNHSVNITVTDNGCGMSDEIREKMFDPFFTTQRSGTGLGLAVSHQIIEQHGGTFDVQTEAGTGTSISMRLPK